MRYTIGTLVVMLVFGSAQVAKAEREHRLVDARRAVLVSHYLNFCPDFSDKDDMDLHLTVSYTVHSAFGVHEDPGEYAEHMLHLTVVTMYEASVRETAMPPCKDLWGAYTDRRKEGYKSSQAIFMAAVTTIVSHKLKR